MAYIGREPLGGEVILMNSIESQFNGVLTTFNLTRTVSGITSAFYPVGTEQLLVSLGGVIQQPDPTGNTGFRISSNTIIFAIAPVAGASCFIVAYGNLTDIGAPANNTVTTDKLVDGSVTPIKLSTGGPWWLSNGNVGIGTTNPGQLLELYGNNKLIKVNSTTDNSSIVIGQWDVANNRIESVNRPLYITTYTGNINLGPSNSQVLSITQSSNVGIGITNPTEKFHIQSTGVVYTAVESTTAVNTGLRLKNTQSDWYIINDSAGDIQFYNGSRHLNITSTGNVGIGTANPGAKLHVVGGRIIVENTSDPAIEIRDGSGSQAGFFFHDSTYDNLVIRHADVSGENHLVLTNSGNIGIGTTNALAKLSVGSGSISDPNVPIQINAPTGQIIYYGANKNGSYGGLFGHDFSLGGVVVRSVDPLDSINLVVNNTTLGLRVTSAGYVGIGTTNPGYTLEVNGSFAATTKSFVIPHPSKPNYKLRYACLEGPENSIFVRGRTQENIIELPDYWIDLVHEESITVNLTPVGNKRIWLEEINNNKVYINSEDTIDCHYIVFAERKDVEKLVVEIEEN